MLLDATVHCEGLVDRSRPAKRVAQRQISFDQRGPLTGPERQLHPLLMMQDRIRLQGHEPIRDRRRSRPSPRRARSPGATRRSSSAARLISPASSSRSASSRCRSGFSGSSTMRSSSSVTSSAVPARRSARPRSREVRRSALGGRLFVHEVEVEIGVRPPPSTGNPPPWPPAPGRDHRPRRSIHRPARRPTPRRRAGRSARAAAPRTGRRPQGHPTSSPGTAPTPLGSARRPRSICSSPLTGLGRAPPSPGPAHRRRAGPARSARGPRAGAPRRPEADRPPAGGGLAPADAAA